MGPYAESASDLSRHAFTAGKSAGQQHRFFISYSRDNRRLAQRLLLDLERAGLDGWLDTQHIPPCSSDWEQEITTQIRDRQELLHLISPESLRSDPVNTELQLAVEAGLALRRLSLTAITDVPAVIRKEQVHDWSCRKTPYRDCLKSLLRDFQLDHLIPADPLADLDASDFQPHRDPQDSLEGPRVQDRDFSRTWVDVTPYSCTWLIAPKTWRGKAPDTIAVLLRFSGDMNRQTHQEVLARRLQSGASAWILVVDGHQPNDKNKYYMPPGSPHIWEDALHACMRLLNAAPIKARKIDLFLDCPAILALTIGQRLDRERKIGLYQYEPADSSYHRLELSR